MTQEQTISLMRQWDSLDGAVQRMLVAQPHQMTEAAIRLDRQRMAMRDLIQKITQPGAA